MGVVFRAEDPILERVVALKAMLPALAASPANRQRFLREAKAAAAIEHDHVVTIYLCGEDRGIPYLAMQLLHGESLETRLRRQGRLPAACVLRIGREVAEALAAAHARGLVHRDIKPSNIWLETLSPLAPGGSRVKVLDFGLARAVCDSSALTQSGALLGSPGYMAPEQVRGGSADPRSDLFSLGCVLYRMCTGTLPFSGPDTLAILAALAVQTPRPVRELNPAVPAALATLVMRLLEKEPARRPPSARAVADALAIQGAEAEDVPHAAAASRAEPLLTDHTSLEESAADLKAASRSRPLPREGPPTIRLQTGPAAAVEELPGDPDVATQVLPPPPRRARPPRSRLWLIAGGLTLTLLGVFLVCGGVVVALWQRPSPKGDQEQAAAQAGEAREAEAPGKAKEPDPRWTVLFRADDPSLWNTDSPGARFAMPLRKAPAVIRHLRLRRMDSGEALILALRRDDLDRVGIPTPQAPHRWNGTSKAQWGGRHLGIAQAPRHKFPAPKGMIVVAFQGWDVFQGSGFGHKSFRNDTQYYCWRGKEIPRTVFEIAVTAEPLTAQEKRCLLAP
jgi:serine/threonine protein kinase